MDSSTIDQLGQIIMDNTMEVAARDRIVARERELLANTPFAQQREAMRNAYPGHVVPRELLMNVPRPHNLEAERREVDLLRRQEELRNPEYEWTTDEIPTATLTDPEGEFDDFTKAKLIGLVAELRKKVSELHEVVSELQEENQELVDDNLELEKLNVSLSKEAGCLLSK